MGLVLGPRSFLGREFGQDSEEVGDGVEGDSGGGGALGDGGEHGGGGEGGEAVAVVECVHGGGEVGAALVVVELAEEAEGVEGVGDELGELDADEVGALVLGATGAGVPELFEGVDEGFTVLALGELELGGPAATVGGAFGVVGAVGPAETTGEAGVLGGILGGE